jgi:hypothetical protein
MRYRAWFAFDRSTRGKPNGFSDRAFCCMTHKASHVRAIAQFRLGVHWLKVERGRALNLKRSDRRCELCIDNDVEDELHVMTCTSYDGIRHLFPALFESDEYRAVFDAMHEHSADIDSLFKGYINGQGSDFWYQLGDFLIMSQKLRI